MYRMQLHEEIAQIFLKTNQNMSRYVPLVLCMTELAKLKTEAATSFIFLNIHHDLISDTKLTFYTYKKAQDFEEEGGKLAKRKTY